VQIIVNGEPREASPAATISQLLADLEINVRHVAVELNQQLVPRAEHAARLLAEGDRLEVVTLVGGG
jgi:sulfur carrier protein